MSTNCPLTDVFTLSSAQRVIKGLLSLLKRYKNTKNNINNKVTGNKLIFIRPYPQSEERNVFMSFIRIEVTLSRKFDRR